VRACVRTYVHTCVPLCVWMQTCVPMHTCVRASACVRAYVRVRACMHTCECVRVCVHACVRAASRCILNRFDISDSDYFLSMRTSRILKVGTWAGMWSCRLRRMCSSTTSYVFVCFDDSNLYSVRWCEPGSIRGVYSTKLHLLFCALDNVCV